MEENDGKSVFDSPDRGVDIMRLKKAVGMTFFVETRREIDTSQLSPDEKREAFNKYSKDDMICRASFDRKEPLPEDMDPIFKRGLYFSDTIVLEFGKWEYVDMYGRPIGPLGFKPIAEYPGRRVK